MITRRRLLALTKSVVSFPSTSYHEHGLRTHLARHADDLGLPTACDRWGNLHVRYSRGRQKVRWTFLAHLDHPGFVITEVRGKHAKGRWFGGVLRHYFKDERVQIHTSEGPVRGRILSTQTAGSRRRVRWVRLETEAPVAPGDIGTWNLAPWKQGGDRLQTRAADDLVGCAALAGLLESLATERRNAQVDVVYTRAEESGLVGAISLARSGMIDKASPIVAIETSSERPSARIGQGVVLRVGDRMSVYDPGLCRFLQDAAIELTGTRKRFRYQRCLMDGGLCEASAFLAHGYRATGLALPLGNYHNMGRSRIALEEVSVVDLVGLTALAEQCVTRRWPPSGRPAIADPIELDSFVKGQEPVLRRSVYAPPKTWKQP